EADHALLLFFQLMMDFVQQVLHGKLLRALDREAVRRVAIVAAPGAAREAYEDLPLAHEGPFALKRGKYFGDVAGGHFREYFSPTSLNPFSRRRQLSHSPQGFDPPA